jgi:hypothetical protein
VGLRWIAIATLLVAGTEALAHDIEIPLAEIRYGVTKVDETLQLYDTQPPIPPLPQTPAEQRLVLGYAEIELAMGDWQKALQLLMGRLADPKFRELPEYVATLLMTSQILENVDDHAGAMFYAEAALRQGGTPDQMAEAGARWFRIARRSQRLDRRLDIYEIWRSKGGETAAGSEVASSVRYEAAFALRADNRLAEARMLLSRVPSDSAYGSRAAYLAGVVFVEEGDLANAEKWFAAVMEWPMLPDISKEQASIEREVRDLAALAAARLRYERGDTDLADGAYRLIDPASRHQAEACWERAYLDLERGKRRGSLKRVQCVLDLGAKGSRFVDAKLFRASLLAHVSRYADSIESFQLLHAELEKERDLFEQASAEIEGHAEFLFSGMERNALDHGRDAGPGPSTLFADAWNADVDRAYRVDRAIDHAREDLGLITNEIAGLTALLAREDAFGGLELRREQLERLLREVHHLQGHAGDLQFSTKRRHASTRLVASGHDHSEDGDELARLLDQLGEQARRVEGELLRLDRIEASRRQMALRMLAELDVEMAAIAKDAAALEAEADGSANGVAKRAIDDVTAALADSAMRAEVGVLDTYWLKKQHRTEQIQNLGQLQKESEAQADEAIQAITAED